MAKKKKVLTTEQKIKQYNAKRKRRLALRILIPTVLLLLAIPLSYFGYYHVVFGTMAERAGDSYKKGGAGYSRPLQLFERVDEDWWNCSIAYYYNGSWYVVDDTETIMANQENFIVYKSDNEWHEGRHEQLYLVVNRYMRYHVPLGDFTLIDDRCFRDSKVKMSMEEFRTFVKENDWKYIEIK